MQGCVICSTRYRLFRLFTTRQTCTTIDLFKVIRKMLGYKHIEDLAFRDFSKRLS